MTLRCRLLGHAWDIARGLIVRGEVKVPCRRCGSTAHVIDSWSGQPVSMRRED